MSKNENTLFELLDRSVSILQKELEISYLEALIETGENLLDDQSVRVVDNKPNEETVKTLTSLYQEMKLTELTPEEIRQGIQLTTLKGMKEGYVQSNHQMTPDSIGSLMAYLIEIIHTTEKKEYHLVDLTIGTGNLLFTAYHFLSNKDRTIKATGIDNDELLISLAAVSAKLQNVPLQLMYQDALQNLLINPADVMVSDLPVGYYPVDDNAKRFDSSFEKGHSYSHFLLIEQSLHYLVDGGLGFFLVPRNLFETEESKTLLKTIQEVGYFQALIQLPKELFQNEQSQKALLVLQKKGEDAKQAKEVLLATAPELNNIQSMKEFIGEINLWKKNYFA